MQQIHSLPTGTLSLNIERSDLPPDALFGIGARENPKRAFLFVSKVLGKHYPVESGELQRIFQRLAAKLPAPEGKISLFIGMAETATALAQGVFEAWLNLHPQAQALYLHSSRLQAQGYPLCEFEESHSHASRQLLHLPTAPELRHLLQQAQRLILIDDELSTGRTFVQLHQALQQRLAQPLEQHWLCLTDFCATATPNIQRHSLLSGNWQFQPNAAFTAQAQEMPSAQQAANPPLITDSGSGRTGIAQCLPLSASALTEFAAAHHKEQRILVLGTGEYIHPPAVFARELAAASGAKVFLQSSTRSPALVWNILQHKQSFADPYDEGINYYLYNLAEPRAYDHIYLCHEHPANAALQAQAKALGASLIQLPLLYTK